MPNTFLKPSVIAAVALERLRRELVLPRLVTRMGLADFRGALNDTVNVRVPAVLAARDYEWRTRTAPIVIDTIAETTVPVVLDKHPYSAVAVTDEELTLDIADFAAQVLEPQVIGVAEKLEAYMAATMAAVTYHANNLLTYTEQAVPATEARFYNALVDAREVLNNWKVPLTNRIAVIGSGMEAAALKEDAFRRVDESGDNSALRAAQIGRVAGFDVFVTQSLPANMGYAFHKSAYIYANVAPEVPAGVSFGQSIAESGLAIRWIRDYDPNFLRDRSVLSAFAGSAAVADGAGPAVIRAVRITGTLL
jgi:coat protein Gp5